ncbi:MAG: YCF48-related protein [Thermoguttaceae bacterium]
MANAAILALMITLQIHPIDPAVSDTMRSDARLIDVCFVDPHHGWAVGDRGTIWHTDDGGRRWQLQRSGVACRLESVCFIDAHNGWAAGGFSHPYTHTGSGVLLSTNDGGRHWQPIPGLVLPPIKRLRFFNRKHGWAVGCSSAMFPSGVMTTDSGGRTWRPVTGAKPADWVGGDFLDPHNGALAGRLGTPAMVRQGGVEPVRMGSFGLRNLRQVKLVAPVYGWLVGDGGLVMMTADLGASWQSPPGALPEGLTEHFDFEALAVRGPSAWIAGTPGSRVFHSPDAGRTWHAFATGTSLPIRAMTFADDRHGWAVGELGTILATADGGQTWQRQRAGGGRAALLGIFADGRDVPLELFAKLCGEEGYLGAVELLNRRDFQRPASDEVPAADRAHEALVAVGADAACTAWRFPLQQEGLMLPAERIVDGWDRANDGVGLSELQSHVVRRLRMWRPDVIVTYDANPHGKDPLGHLINQVVFQAVRQAADPTSFAEQITLAGLQPWSVKKIYAKLPPAVHGSNDLVTDELAARLGGSLADVSSMPHGLLDDRFTAAPPRLGFHLVHSDLPQASAGRDMFSGFVLLPGGEARRALQPVSPERLEALQWAAKRQRNARAILEQTQKDPLGGMQLAAQSDDLIRGLDADGAVRVLYHLAGRYHHSGRWTQAAEIYRVLVDRYAEHPLSRTALIWLVQYYAGGEPAWRIQGAQRFAVRQASALSIDTSQQENRPDRAAELGKLVERIRPELFARPELRFPLAVAHRRQGYPRQAERYFLSLTHGSRRDCWWECARSEQWFAEPKGELPKSFLSCVVARRKPRLDGQLDDAVWQRATPATLNDPQKDDAGQADARQNTTPSPATVMLAYDAEFLYLAMRCPRAPGIGYEAAEGPRSRDPDLSAHDRVEVFLDLDRDFATYYRLVIDHRGQPAEDCWGDRTWNPTWFVAAATDGDAWTAEAAIPMDQLTGRYPTSRTVWALGLQRTTPTVGFQSWTTPAATNVVPEGFGYLVFE